MSENTPPTRNPMECRPLLANERAVAQQVFAATIEGAGLLIDARDLAELQALPESCRSGGGEFWVVDIAGALVGTGGIRPVTKGIFTGEWEIKWLSMSPAWQGMGIGRMVTEKVILFATEAGATRIRIALHTALAPACTLFRSLHFQVVENINPTEYAGALTFRRILG